MSGSRFQKRQQAFIGICTAKEKSPKIQKSNTDKAREKRLLTLDNQYLPMLEILHIHWLGIVHTDS